MDVKGLNMLNSAKLNDYVEIEIMVLEPKDRSKNVPEDTAKLPYKAFIKGHLVNQEANLGDMVKIKSPIGREIEGVLSNILPPFTHGYGHPIPELLTVGNELKEILDESGEA